MRIQYLSDLHLESHAFTLKVRSDADVLVLAGDLATAKHEGRFERLLREAGDIPTVVIHGNHEFYNDRMEDAKARRIATCSRFPNVHLLDDSWTIINGIQFIGTTLWSDFALPFTQGQRRVSDPVNAMRIAAAGITDFHVIGCQGRLFAPADAATFHQQARQVIKARAQAAGATVVVSHFLPSERSVDPQFATSSLNPYFASNCEDLMGGNVRAWLHGHTHASCSYHVNGTEVACNPRGYTKVENRQFNSQAYIDVAA